MSKKDETEFDPDTDPNRQVYPSVGWGRSPRDVWDDAEKQRKAKDKKEK